MTEKIIALTAEHLGIDADSISETSSFKEDLGVDSLDLFELVMAFEENFGIEIPNEGLYDLYIGARGEDGKLASFKLANALRTRGIKTEINHMGRSLKAEMKYANKIGAKFTVVLGDDELQTGNAKLKRMSDGEQFEVNLNNIEEIVAILNC